MPGSRELCCSTIVPTRLEKTAMLFLGRVFFAGALTLWLPWRKRTGCSTTVEN